MGLINWWKNRGNFTCKTCNQPKKRDSRCGSRITCRDCWFKAFNVRWDAMKEKMEIEGKIARDIERFKLASALKDEVIKLQRANQLAYDLSQVGSDQPIQFVPDHCDHIVWRGRHYHLPNLLKKEPT